MMPSTEQPRWFPHPPHHSGIPSSTHYPEVSGGGPFSSGSVPAAHHPAIHSYVEPGGYLDEMENYLQHFEGSAGGYYGLNMQYRAAHQRSLTGEFGIDCFSSYNFWIRLMVLRMY